MGPGCKSVRRVQTTGTEFVVGEWNDGRIGTYRGYRKGPYDFRNVYEYGAFVYGMNSFVKSDGFTGYEPLVEKIITFFKTGEIPVSAKDTIEIYAFMTAADESKARNGAEVSLQSVIDKAEKR